jgi:hypothetical protein
LLLYPKTDRVIKKPRPSRATPCAWGANWYGQLGDGTAPTSGRRCGSAPTPPGPAWRPATSARSRSRRVRPSAGIRGAPLPATHESDPKPLICLGHPSGQAYLGHPSRGSPNEDPVSATPAENLGQHAPVDRSSIGTHCHSRCAGDPRTGRKKRDTTGVAKCVKRTIGWRWPRETSMHSSTSFGRHPGAPGR